MGWWLPRTLAAWLALALGAVLGASVGAFWADRMPSAAAAGAVIGAGLGLALALTRDAWRGQRLMEWLRGSQVGLAPRDAGFWGELAYRFEKSMRERERAVDEERRRLDQFLSAIEASPNGVMMLNSDEQIEWCNSQSSDHFGVDPSRDRLQRVTNLVREPAFVAYLQNGQYDEPVVFADLARRRRFSVQVRPYGEGMKLVLSQDITERERADGMRRDFVANVSHEIRTPLTVLAGFVETLASLPLSEVERQRVLQLMSQQTQRMQALVADLLTLAQLEGSPRPPPDRWHDVSTLFARVHADAAVLSSGRHRIEFEANTEGAGPAALAGSETELHSALGNLVNNAVRYTPDGGRITVRWRWREDGGGEIEVSDTGVGIPREHLARLTERFYRVDSSRSRETGGTGLGLSIVKHVAQRHGGSIEIASEPGQGSCFRLVFPATRVRHSPATVASGERSPSPRLDRSAA